MDELENELDDFISINKSMKEEIKSFYKAWSTCLSHKIIIENIEGESMIIDDSVTYHDKVIPIELTSTLHFVGCHNLVINVKRKVNHITIERCNNIKIMISSGCISGLDTIKSKFIDVLIDNKSIYFIDVGTSSDCNYCIRDHLCDEIFISSIDSIDIKVYVVVNKEIQLKSEMDLTSIFGNYKLFQLI